MEVDRTKLLALGGSIAGLMALLEILGSLGFHNSNRGAIIGYYIIVSTVLLCSVVFTVYQARQRCVESIIV